jgi:hypothetical protein
MENRLSRKLATILCTDVAGCSRLTGDSDDATHRALSESLDLIINTHSNVRYSAGNRANNEANGYSIAVGIWKRGFYPSYKLEVIQMNKPFEVKFDSKKADEDTQ